ncbi:MAG: aldehyde dehydrogenase family protein, partial [Parahaliea sp.]
MHDIATLLSRQRTAHLTSEPWTAEYRCALLDKAIGLLVDHEQASVEALNAEFGHRSADFPRWFDIASPIATWKKTRAQVAEWMKPEPRESSARMGEAWIHYQPLGVVGIVTAWNFPVNLVFSGLAGVLAAGNRAMIKVSEFNPHTAQLL